MDNSGRYPDGVVQVVSFSRGLAREEMQECVRDGRAEAERIRAAERLPTPQEPTVMIDWWGSEEAVPGNSSIGGAWRRIRGTQVVQRPTSEVGNVDDPQPDLEGSFRRRSAPTLASPVVESEGGMWLVCESFGPVGYELGVEVGMGTLCVQRRNRGLHHVRAGQYVCVELVRARDLDSRQRKRQLLDERSGGTEATADELLRERLFGTAPGQREDARARMSTEDAPAGTGEEAVDEDLRTLWIDRDDQGQRFKEWKKVCSESSEERQAVSPVAGPPSCLTVCKQMQHHGGNPKLWMHLWMKELGASGKDRLYHEVATLVEILYQGGTYDQLGSGCEPRDCLEKAHCDRRGDFERA